jgi:hypothetical protein
VTTAASLLQRDAAASAQAVSAQAISALVIVEIKAAMVLIHILEHPGRPQTTLCSDNLNNLSDSGAILTSTHTYVHGQFERQWGDLNINTHICSWSI